MADITGVLIDEPAPNTRRTILSSQTPPVFKSNGQINVLCGNCKTVLCEGLADEKIENIVIRCPHCRGLNNVTI
ncbi:Com family DNA-binding transcriptional regulator [Dehalogenimonas sp. THU2]|uniref:Com family DNA-binding transcriptional regulator n=1 Tax=Dehalogenimonas sp. THU2 TaxID=3151121 RepID=UPI003218DABE